MRIIIKFILKNIREKKLRTLLITISVAAACALFFASNGISDSYRNAYTNMLRSNFGSSDIFIYPDQKSPSPYFKTDKAELFKDKTEYVIGEMDGSGIYEVNKNESVAVALKGIDYDDLNTMNPVNLLVQSSLKPFTGNKVIISKSSADKYGYKAGDKIKIKIGDSEESFTIVGISAPESVFKTESMGITAVIPRVTMAEMNAERGEVSTIYIKSRNIEERQSLIKDLSEKYKNYNVKETINEKEIDEDLQSITASFMMMLTIVLVMSIFIIYTAFKVIIMERMPVIGTFRSIGATKKTTNLVLIAESILYGIFGGIIGDLLGIGILYVVGVVMNPFGAYFKTSLEFRPELLAQAFLFGVFVSFISALLPILKVSRISVKDIVLNSMDSKEIKKYWKIVIGILLICFSIIAPLNPPHNSSLVMLIDLMAMLSVVIAIVLLIPYINSFFVIILGTLYSLIFGNEGTLAAKNLRDNKSILNNISLLCIGISALLMINVLSFSINKEVSKAYGAFNCDIIVGPQAAIDADKNSDLRKLAAIPGVTDNAGIMEMRNIEVDLAGGRTEKIFTIDSVDSDKFSSYIGVEFSGAAKGIPGNFDDERNIMITSQLKDRFGVNEGDTISLKTNSGNRDYKIAAVFNTLMQNGNYAFIPVRYMKSDFKVKNYEMIFVKTNGDNEAVKSSIKNTYKGRNYFVDTVSHMEEDNAKANEQMMNQLRAFPFIAIIIGAFGVINNFILSFIERRRAFAVLASIGMSRRQRLKVLFIEGLSSGIIGGIMGIGAGFGMTAIVPSVMSAMQLPIPMHYTASLFAVCFALAVVITLISSVAPAMRASKMNIVEAIKFE